MYSPDVTRTAPDPHPPTGANTVLGGESTRERVLQVVLTHGPVSAAEVGSRLGLTAAAVRRHLDVLSEEGTVEVKLIAGNRGAGRPSRRYVVSHQGQAELGDDYLTIATDALGRLAQMQGPEAIRLVARDRFTEVERRFAESVASAAADGAPLKDLLDRTDTLAQVLDELGFAASIRLAGVPAANEGSTGPGAPDTASLPMLRAAQICQGHCPLQEVAARFPEFCEEETGVFARLLGVDVRRLSTMPTGGHVCTTHVPLGRTRPPEAPGRRRDPLPAPPQSTPDQSDTTDHRPHSQRG